MTDKNFGIKEIDNLIDYQFISSEDKIPKELKKAA